MSVNNVDRVVKDVKRVFLVWVGCGATIGTPNTLTGRYDYNGDLLAFASEKERTEACDTFDYKYNNYPVPTNRKEAKSLYCAGMSQKSFDEWLDNIVPS